jgi:hypothetical protein
VNWYGINTDIDDRKRAEALLAGEKRLLEMVASGQPLPVVLNALCELVEETIHGCSCGIVLVDATGTHLQHGARLAFRPVTMTRLAADRALERGPRDAGHDLVTGYARFGEPPTASMSRSSALRQLSTKFRGEAKHPDKEQKSKANTNRQPQVLPGIGQFQDGREGGCNNHCQTRGCDEKNTPQDLAISLLWVASVHARDKGFRVISAQRIVAVPDNLIVFFLCKRFLLG